MRASGLIDFADIPALRAGKAAGEGDRRSGVRIEILS
jgi:hypothetical protein